IDRKLLVRMERVVEGGRGDPDRNRDPRAQDRRRRVSLGVIDEHPVPKRPLLVGLPIPAERDFVLRSASNVIEGRTRDFRPGHVLELEEIREREAHDGRRWTASLYAFGPWAAARGWPDLTFGTRGAPSSPSPSSGTRRPSGTGGKRAGS